MGLISVCLCEHAGGGQVRVVVRRGENKVNILQTTDVKKLCLNSVTLQSPNESTFILQTQILSTVICLVKYRSIYQTHTNTHTL